MTLRKYVSKRDFKKTPEPKEKSQSLSGSMRFCVQKHDASHLHYDFRLEHRGVLLSWAVPKGPSLDPKDKRLAIKVEDHPLQYLYFEGVIPKGNYGAGTVEIWDKGTYRIHGAEERKNIEKSLEGGLKKGHFNVILEGEKLKGEFVFQKLKSDADDNSWLLIKKDDAYAMSEQPENLERNVKKKLIKLPDFIPPMLATLVTQAFDDEDWLFEIKWDGYRALAFVDQGKVNLKSRSKLNWNDTFPAIVKELKKIKGQVVLDGELVVLDEEGKPHFQLMQNYEKRGVGTLCFYVFDLLYKDGEDLRGLPLISRKEVLKKIINDLSVPFIRFSDHILQEGKKTFQSAAKMGLEGVIGKKNNSAYQSKRSRDWIKIKTSQRQEVVIGGFTNPRGSRKKFGALLVGVYNQQNKLVYSGHVGGGFTDLLLEDVYERLQPFVRTKMPFLVEPKPNEKVTWVKPQLVCEVSFAEWTQDNIMRQPIFLGLRMDKKSKSVTKENPVPILEEKFQKKSFRKTEGKVILTHPEKIYWPEEGYTKGDLFAYYQNVAPYILPYLKDRPVMLHRYPDGIKGTEFYQKDLPSIHPDWIKTCEIEQQGKINHYLLINDLNSLLYAINLASIDLHPFISTCSHLENPYYCIIDLDPHDISFDHVIKTALAIHEILDEISVKHYCKTSGGNGLHVFIPLHGKYTFEQSRQFAEVIGNLIHQRMPKTTSLERSPGKRPKKIYLDCLQNRTGQTIVAPYAVRPRPHALVSAPLRWDELKAGLRPSLFDIKTVPKRLKKIGDIFAPVLKECLNMKKALKELQRYL